MARETKQIETPVSKQVIVLNTYITGREFEYVQAPLFEAMSLAPAPIGEVSVNNININKVNESTHRLLEKLVVSVDGSTENVLDTLLDMRKDDYEFIVDTVNEMSKKN